MNQEQLEGIARGNERAEDAANNAGALWKADAFNHLVSYAKRMGRFHADQARIYAFRHGLESPPDNRAWGAVISSAARQGLIKKDGFEPVYSPGNHGRPMYIWKWVGAQ